MSGKRTHSFKCAVHQRDCEVYSEENFYLRPEDVRLFEKVVHVTAVEMLPDKRDRRYYEDRYTCCPPPWFIMLITIVEVQSIYSNVICLYKFIIFRIASTILLNFCDRITSFGVKYFDKVWDCLSIF